MIWSPIWHAEGGVTVTEMQQVFLLYVLIYYVVKIGIFAAFYVTLIMVEKHARQRKAQVDALFMKRRAEEKERWKVAYRLYDQQKSAEPGMEADATSMKVPSSMVTLIHNTGRRPTRKLPRRGNCYRNNRMVSGL